MSLNKILIDIDTRTEFNGIDIALANESVKKIQDMNFKSDDEYLTALNHLKKILDVLTKKFEAKHREYFLNTQEISIHKLSERTKEILSKEIPGFNDKWNYAIIDHLVELVSFTINKDDSPIGAFELDDFMESLNKLKVY